MGAGCIAKIQASRVRLRNFSKLDLAPDVLEKFSEVRFPAVLDLAIETVPARQGLRSVVVGFRASGRRQSGLIVCPPAPSSNSKRLPHA
jgi:hypothetical protein